jgi:hypothetical protein
VKVAKVLVDRKLTRSIHPDSSDPAYFPWQTAGLFANWNEKSTAIASGKEESHPFRAHRDGDRSSEWRTVNYDNQFGKSAHLQLAWRAQVNCIALPAATSCAITDRQRANHEAWPRLQTPLVGRDLHQTFVKTRTTQRRKNLDLAPSSINTTIKVCE